jgi:hypothetical protein
MGNSGLGDWNGVSDEDLDENDIGSRTALN